MNLAGKLKRLEALQSTAYYADRIASELLYIYRVSQYNGGKYDIEIENACDHVLACLDEEGSITKHTAETAEEMLAGLSEAAKAYTAYCVAHAHIDMNWKWGYQETVAVVIETFKTMLHLMNEYPDFRFAQSQASVYKIIEEYAPEILDEIRARIQEGRWEVSASTWTECDKNMPSGESLTRQILYTKRYLSKLLEIAPETLNLDFEPDTFGHNINVPEILQNGGVDYYYHCRGCDNKLIYRWRAASGKEILAYQEPKWYLGEIDSKGFCDYPIFCGSVCEGGFPAFLKVYGVGDHGGGPSRRDIERIIDMNTWPLFPTMKFSTYKEFFKILEPYREKFPVVNGELNFVFTGCYTTQSRIKMANRLGEARLYDSEALSVGASVLTDASSRAVSFEKAWENVLFSQFHDILPGSGVTETREFCLGGFQKTMAYANSNANAAMHAIADAIDTSALPFDDSDKADTVSEGGGVGFRIDAPNGYQFTSAEMGRGRTRVIHIFNTTSYKRREPAEITVFDYTYDLDNIEILDTEGNSVDFQITEKNKNFNHHRLFRFLIDAEVPPLGYTTYVIRQKDDVNAKRLMKFEFRRDPRQDLMEDAPIVLENLKLRAVFDPQTMALTSFIDKATGKEMADSKRKAGIIRFAEESNRDGMSAWRVGPIMNSINLNEQTDVRITSVKSETMRRSVTYEMVYRLSKFTVTVSLDGESDVLLFDITADWHEIGTPATFVPQINFHFPVGYSCENYRYDIPYGHITRKPLAHDVPALSYIEMLENGSETSAHIMMMTDTKYGYRGYDNSGTVTLIRSAHAPDPLPESGIFRIKIGIAVADTADSARRLSDCFNHRMPYIAGLRHSGTLPLCSKFFGFGTDTETLKVSAIKSGEDGGFIVRLYEENGCSGKASISFPEVIKYAAVTDTNEVELKKLDIVSDKNSSKVEFEYLPCSLVTLKFKK